MKDKAVGKGDGGSLFATSKKRRRTKGTFCSASSDVHGGDKTWRPREEYENIEGSFTSMHVEEEEAIREIVRGQGHLSTHGLGGGW